MQLWLTFVAKNCQKRYTHLSISPKVYRLFNQLVGLYQKIKVLIPQKKTQEGLNDKLYGPDAI